MPETLIPESEMLDMPTELYALQPAFKKSELMRQGGVTMRQNETFIADRIIEKNKTVPVGEDLEALARVIYQWRDDEVMEVGESATLYRISKMLFWTRGGQDSSSRFKLSGTLRERPVTDNRSIIEWPLVNLATLDGGTTQWASAAMLVQNRTAKEVREFRASLPEEKRYMINMTIHTISRMMGARATGSFGDRFRWGDRERDDTYERLSRAFWTRLVTGHHVDLQPRHSEEVPFVVMDGGMILDEARLRYPWMANHETPRFDEMETIMEQPVIDTADHRLAIAALQTRVNPKWTPRTERAVRKSWPHVLQFVEAAHDLASAA